MNRTVLAPLAPGVEIDNRFRIVERRGSGAMGVVFRAEDIWLGRPVAIKMVDAAFAHDEAAAKYFQQEARSLAQVRHESVVHVYTFGKHAGVFYFAMEYIDGPTLDAIIEEHAACGETIELGRALDIIRAIGRGLGAVHERRLVHRDVKPGNIVIERETNRPVLVDFGLARRAKSSSPRSTTTAGTPWYMAPEQARDTDGTRTTPAADIYAFACTAFELLTNRPVFERKSIYDVLLAHLNESPPAISSYRPELAPLDAIFAKALAKLPEGRHASCAELIAEIDAAIGDRASRVRSVRPSPPPRRTPSPDAVRIFLLERDESLARQITRAADRVLGVPAIECFTSAADLVRAFEHQPAEIVVLDEDASVTPPATIIRTLRMLPRGDRAEIVVLSRSWDGSNGLAEFNARELPKPINSQVLSSVLRNAGTRVRSNPPPS